MGSLRRRALKEFDLVLTRHATDRVMEMGVPLEALAEIVARGSSYPARAVDGGVGQCFRLEGYPWSVVMSRQPGEERYVITVLFATMERYERQGTTYRVIE